MLLEPSFTLAKAGTLVHVHSAILFRFDDLILLIELDFSQIGSENLERRVPMQK